MNISDLLASLASGKGVGGFAITPGQPAMDITQLVSQVGRDAPQAAMPMAPNLPAQPPALPGAPVGAMNLPDLQDQAANAAQTGGYMGIGAGLQGNIPKTPLPPPETEPTAPKGMSSITTGSVTPSALGAHEAAAPDFSPSFAQSLINVGNALQGKSVTDLAGDTQTKNATYAALIKRGVDPTTAEVAVRNPNILQQIVPMAFGPAAQSQAAIKSLLTSRGMDPTEAEAASRSPEILSQIAPVMFGVKPPTKLNYGEHLVSVGTDGQYHDVTPNLAGGSSGNPNLTGQDYLASLPPARANLLKSIVEGRAPPLTGRQLSTAQGQQLMADLSQYEPGFDLTKWTQRNGTAKSFNGGGADAQTINNLNTAVNHLDKLDQAIDGLGNRSFTPWNYVANEYEQIKGDPRVSNFETAKKAVMDEMATVFAGKNGSGVGDREAWEAKLSSSQSPAQLKSNVRQLIDLMNGRLEGLADKYNQGMSTQLEPRSFLTPKSRQILDRIESEGTGQTQPASPQQQAAPTTAKQQQTNITPSVALQQARQAIAAGKDPLAVKARLKQLGIDPAGL